MNRNLSNLEHRLLQSVSAEETGNHEELFQYQEEAVKQLRGALSYMKSKYSGTEIEYILFEPLTKMTDKGILACTLKGSDEAARVIIRRKEDSYLYTDTLYGLLVREKYDAELEKIISAFMPEVRAYTSFYTAAGENVNRDTSVAQLNSHLPVLSRHTDLAVCCEPHVFEGMIGKLRDGSFYGSYTVCNVGREAMDAGNPFENRAEWYGCLTFNVFRTPGESRGAE